MARYAEFQDSAGRHYVEHDMPEETAYQHPIRSYGDARRLSVYDTKDATLRSSKNTGGHIAEDPKGEPGLVGYSDFYREPLRDTGVTFVHKDEHGNETRERAKPIADVNVGFMSVHDKYKGGGIGRQMFDYMHKTTPAGSVLNVGKAAHNATLHMSKKLSEEKPGSVKYKLF
jgi:GNAT superfamily N-acetyltransferase